MVFVIDRGKEKIQRRALNTAFAGIATLIRQGYESTVAAILHLDFLIDFILFFKKLFYFNYTCNNLMSKLKILSLSSNSHQKSLAFFYPFFVNLPMKICHFPSFSKLCVQLFLNIHFSIIFLTSL